MFSKSSKARYFILQLQKGLTKDNQNCKEAPWLKADFFQIHCNGFWLPCGV